MFTGPLLCARHMRRRWPWFSDSRSQVRLQFQEALSRGKAEWEQKGWEDDAGVCVCTHKCVCGCVCIEMGVRNKYQISPAPES